MRIWLTADTHWGHSNIIRLVGRPFSSVEEMDEAMIDNWNARVGPKDMVYHLGDFCWKGKAQEYRKKLNGKICLIRGNHDKNIGDADFEWVKDMETISVDGTAVVLCHYPLAEWDGYYRGHIHLHGHCHGKVKPIKGRLDVGVDCWEYRPVLLEEVLERFGR
jgi:calcineurin-like phosphoesterase family protein